MNRYLAAVLALALLQLAQCLIGDGSSTELDGRGRALLSEPTDAWDGG
jgi:hypothetical protein